MNVKDSSSADASIVALQKDWDEVLCPICMDHPHNAILLICSSHDKGCRSYICDTSYRHSNCFDRFKKLNMNNWDSSSSLENSSNASLDQSTHLSFTSGSISWSPNLRRNIAETHEHNNNVHGNNDPSPAGLTETLEESDNNQAAGVPVEARGERRVDTSESNCLKCPLCRGPVLNWMIVKEARQYLDQKSRACSLESCAFFGNYKELREHARGAHQTKRPADVDPSRRRAWRHFEHQREYGDILSAVRSAMPSAVVLGDYAIDNGDVLPHDREGGGSGEGSRPWWATFILFHMMDSPIRSQDEPRRSSGSWRRHGRTRHRYLWGESLLGLQYDDDNDSNLDDEVPIPRRRRRIARSRTEEHP